MRVAFEAECGVGKGVDCASSSCTTSDVDCSAADDGTLPQDAGTSMQNIPLSQPTPRHRVERAKSLPSLVSLNTMPATSTVARPRFAGEQGGAPGCDPEHHDTSSTLPWYASWESNAREACSYV